VLFILPGRWEALAITAIGVAVPVLGHYLLGSRGAQIESMQQFAALIYFTFGPADQHAGTDQRLYQSPPPQLGKKVLTL
jgi:hypothetical protein